MNWDDFRLEFDNGDHLYIEGRSGWREAICVVCEEPIRWCLDMFSFTTGERHGLAHASCVWTREGVEDVAAKMRAPSVTYYLTLRRVLRGQQREQA